MWCRAFEVNFGDVLFPKEESMDIKIQPIVSEEEEVTLLPLAPPPTCMHPSTLSK